MMYQSEQFHRLKFMIFKSFELKSIFESELFCKYKFSNFERPLNVSECKDLIFRLDKFIIYLLIKD